MAQYKHIFGPVPSRRFGRSLGVDLVSLKTCTFNCIFCEVGETDKLTIERKEYVPIREAIAEVDDWIRKDGNADFVTLAGSGEPTLNTGFGEVLDFLRGKGSFRTAILTNGSLLYLPEVRESAMKADVVKVSLSGSNRGMLERINRLHPGLDFERMLEGMRKFRSSYNRELWLEVILVDGLNDNDEIVSEIASLAKSIGPDKIHLNTVVRPPADGVSAAVPFRRLEHFARMFTPEAEVIVPFNGEDAPSRDLDGGSVVDMLRRRPCSENDIHNSFKSSSVEVNELLERLVADGSIEKYRMEDGIYFRVKRADFSEED